MNRISVHVCSSRRARRDGEALGGGHPHPEQQGSRSGPFFVQEGEQRLDCEKVTIKAPTGEGDTVAEGSHESRQEVVKVSYLVSRPLSREMVW